MTLPGAHRSTRAKDTTFLACSVSLKVWQLPSTCLHLSLHGSLHVYLEMPVLQTAHGCRSSGSTAQGSPSLVHACQKPAGRHACRLRSETMGEGSKAAIVTRVHRRPSWAVPRVGGEHLGWSWCACQTSPQTRQGAQRVAQPIAMVLARHHLWRHVSGPHLRSLRAVEALGDQMQAPCRLGSR